MAASLDWLDVVMGNQPIPPSPRPGSTLPPIDPAARVTYRRYHPTSWVASIGRQAIDEGISEGDLLRRLKDRGCKNPVHQPFQIVIIR